MHKVWGRLPIGLRERPFDMLTAFLLFLLGVYEIADPSWPEAYENDFNTTLLIIVSIYLMCAGVVIMTALLRNPKKCPVFVYFGQMFGWAFVATATFVTTIMYVYYGIVQDIQNTYAFSAWLTIWTILTIVAVIRSIDMWFYLRMVRK